MSQHSLSPRDYLAHMLDAAGQIETYARGKSPRDFLADRLIQDGVVRNIEILGEASRNLLDAIPDAATRFPGIPFGAIYGMRNQLAHGYFAIDLDLGWKVVERDIPALRVELEAAIRELDRPST